MIDFRRDSALDELDRQERLDRALYPLGRRAHSTMAGLTEAHEATERLMKSALSAATLDPLLKSPAVAEMDARLDDTLKDTASTRLAKMIEDAQRHADPASVVGWHTNFEASDRLRETLAKLDEPVRGAMDALDLPARAMRNISRQIADPLYDTVGALVGHTRHATDFLRQNPALLDLMGRIDGERERLEDLERLETTPRFSVPELVVPINPVHETNELLAKIEERFGQLEKTIIEGAKLGNELQGQEVGLLARLETAASQTNDQARRTILLGVFALITAIALTVLQIGYNEFWRVPEDNGALRIALDDMSAEISELKRVQLEAATIVSQGLLKNDAAIAPLLTDIRDLLRGRLETGGMGWMAGFRCDSKRLSKTVWGASCGRRPPGSSIAATACVTEVT